MAQLMNGQDQHENQRYEGVFAHHIYLDLFVFKLSSKILTFTGWGTVRKVSHARAEKWDYVNRLIEGEEPIDVRGRLSGESVMHIISGIVSNSRHLEYQVNLPNEGQVSNLIEGAIVESPAVVDGSGVHPVHVGPMPDGLAALCNIQILVQELAVEAAVNGDSKLALQAMLADPVVQDLQAVRAAFEELMEAHSNLLPQFVEGP